MNAERTPLATRGLIAFTSGAAYEGLSVIWVHQATHGSARATAVVSALQAAAQVVGIGESVRDWRIAPLFVLGYGAGAWAAMVLS